MSNIHRNINPHKALRKLANSKKESVELHRLAEQLKEIINYEDY